MTGTDLIPVTTSSVRLRHYADPADAHKHQPEEGWVGSALCDSQIYTDVYDQVAVDDDRRRWGARPAKRIADLPACKRCASKIARREAVASPMFGKRLKALFVQTTGQEPVQVEDVVGRHVVKVAQYQEQHRPLFDRIWTDYYAGEAS